MVGKRGARSGVRGAIAKRCKGSAALAASSSAVPGLREAGNQGIVIDPLLCGPCPIAVCIGSPRPVSQQEGSARRAARQPLHVTSHHREERIEMVRIPGR